MAAIVSQTAIGLTLLCLAAICAIKYIQEA
jgi:hypothetical protein